MISPMLQSLKPLTKSAGGPMQNLKHISIGILAVAVLSSGLPVFAPEDAARDNTVDLKDAILLVRDFARTAENPADFSTMVKRAVSALQAAAGLKTVIKSDGGPKSTVSPFSIRLPYLVCSFYHVLFSMESAKVPEPSMNYQSIDITPDSPPPRLSSFC
jgi:hypothetical protein